MLSLCGKSICKPLLPTFKACLSQGKFPLEWKKPMLFQSINEEILKLQNYRHVSLLPISGKELERLIYNNVFKNLIDSLISENQFGFKPGDSCINQFFSITYDIYESSDEGFKVKGVFLDISKAFGIVVHEGLIFKSKQNGISENLLNIFKKTRSSFSFKWSIFFMDIC